MLKNTLSYLCLALSPGAIAQGTAEPLQVKFERNKGIVLQQDQLFKMTLRFRMQNRFALISEEGDDPAIGTTDIRVRRLRLRFDGFVLSPKIQYKVQLGFSKSDLDLMETNTAQPIRDAIAYYVPNERWSFGFGQTKLPGNRQRMVSSGALQLPDRSIVNAAFTLDRDFGLFAAWNAHAAGQVVMVKGAMTSGEGRNASPGDEGMCYTGRLEWLPLGEFTDEGDYFEGDLAHEPRPKVSLGAVYSNNIGARRSGGQLGEYFPDDASRTINTFMADALVKYNGTAWSSEYCKREVIGDPVVVSDEDVVVAQEGWGFNTQVGRMLGAKNEVVGRWSIVVPTERLDQIQHRREEAWIGFNRYINHHRVKLQTALSYAWIDGIADLEGTGNKWGLWFQLELGI